ncbi:unnamed protein product [Fraxinus pennsylvanica]|uniref:Uncharacterized protein n=1 Tax=Fraxinus pennsylvanica TaxID=56036 RepID=A0AAD2A1F4_9LAMI|nr:unnamed protein product [Fraxinus pennsylvanica]
MNGGLKSATDHIYRTVRVIAQVRQLYREWFEETLKTVKAIDEPVVVDYLYYYYKMSRSCVGKEDGGSHGNVVLGCHDAEIAQLTKITSSPHEQLSKLVPGKARLPVSRWFSICGRISGKSYRIYNVDHGWKVQKDIRARSLRWTITDTSLSPDCRLLGQGS